MAQAPLMTRPLFERAVAELIQRAKKQNRGEDLDRIVAHLEKRPAEMTKLASLLLMLDEDYRTELQAAVTAYRRHAGQKGEVPSDDDVFEILWGVYAQG